MAESADEYAARLFGAADTQRLRVPRRYRDREGNVIVHVTEIVGVDTDGTPHALVDTSGNFVGGSASAPRYNWPAGTTVEINGTFTKSGAGLGYVDITPASNDQLIFMYGVFRSNTKATAGNMELQLVNGTQICYVYGRDSVSANEENHYPGTGNAASQNNNYTAGYDEWTRLLDSNTSDFMRARLANMANAETFKLILRFRSLLGTAPSTAATGGTWA